MSKITIIFRGLALVIAGLLFSCAGSPPVRLYNPLSELPDANVVGTIQVKFDTIHSEYYVIKINEIAYVYLMEAALREYQGGIDIRDVTWSSLGWNSTKHTGEFSATGKVVLLTATAAAGIEGAVARAAEQTLRSVMRGSSIAIVYITAPDKSMADYIAGELEFIWVKSGYTIVDRSQLDALRTEQKFQMSGEVDDVTAVSIGKMIGANVIATGGVDGEGSLRRLRIRVLDTATSEILGVASEPL